MNKALFVACLFSIATGTSFAHPGENDPVASVISGTRTGSLGCGPRAVYLLLTSIGYDSQIHEISQKIDPDDDGVCSAAEIIAYFKELGLEARFIKCDYSDLLATEDGIILILNNANRDNISHFSMALISADRTVLIADPTVSIDPTPTDEATLNTMWDGLAILVKINHP